MTKLVRKASPDFNMPVDLGIEALENYDAPEGYKNRGVIYNYKGKGYNQVKKFLSAGWKIVYREPELEEENKTSKDTRKEIRKNPITWTSSDGCNYLLMRINVAEYDKRQVETHKNTHTKQFENTSVTRDVNGNIRIVDKILE